MVNRLPLKYCSSWYLIIGIVTFIIGLVSVVNLLLLSLTPSSLNFFTTPPQRVNDLLVESPLVVEHSLDLRFPTDSHNAVVYRNTPWKAEIGRWLSGCGSISKPVSIVERISGKACKDDCNGRGVCNQELGECRCFHGYAGEGCSEKLELMCNYPGTPKEPYGQKVISICPTHCDTTRAMCWCNVDPHEAYAYKVKFKYECRCNYDGLRGRFCEVPVLSTCINQCSSHGYCRGGFCQCKEGWYGIDCSIPTVFSLVQEWPQWLRPATIDLPDTGYLPRDNLGRFTLKKKRPLVYVYDLPPEFNSHLLEGRHYKLECVNRVYNEQNRTLWTDHLYGSQMALLESILASPYRTLNGEEADYFFVPVLDQCIITRAGDAPHLSSQEHKGLRSLLTLEFYKKAYDHIVEKYPFWNRSLGRDHIWSFAWDEGACYAPKEIWTSMMLVHWGNTNTKHNHSTTAYWADNWDPIPSHKRGSHPCFDPEKDLVLPAWKQPDPESLASKLWSRPLEDRKTLFYFNGNLGPAYRGGRREPTYSMGIRGKLAEEFGSTPDMDEKLGRQHSEDVIVTSIRSLNYNKELASSVFCGVLPGDGWSGRMEDSILHGCIPVVIQDGILLPYENVLNYDTFVIRIKEEEIPNLIQILRGFNQTKLESMRENIKMIWQRFIYRDSVLLEAERQKSTFGYLEDWTIEFLRLNEDDVFATFIQILHYKLHNDRWRRKFNSSQKNFGLPKDCLRKVN